MRNEYTDSEIAAMSEDEIKVAAGQEIARMRRAFKQLSKNQLVTLLLQQVSIAIEQQNINKVLLEQLNVLKAKEEAEAQTQTLSKEAVNETLSTTT